MNSPLKPAIPITSRAFAYVPACKTDIRATFAKARADMQRALINPARPWAQVNKP